MAGIVDTLCGWTDTTWGKGLVAGTLVIVGATHFGWLSGIASTSLPVFGNVGNLMGTVAVVGGVCMLGACCLPSTMTDM